MPKFGRYLKFARSAISRREHWQLERQRYVIAASYGEETTIRVSLRNEAGETTEIKWFHLWETDEEIESWLHERLKTV